MQGVGLRGGTDSLREPGVHAFTEHVGAGKRRELHAIVVKLPRADESIAAVGAAQRAVFTKRQLGRFRRVGGLDPRCLPGVLPSLGVAQATTTKAAMGKARSNVLFMT